MTSERLAIFLPTLAGGGAERSMIDLARGFCASGHPTDLVVGQGRGAFAGRVGPPVEVVDLDSRRVLAAIPRLARYIRRVRPRCLLAAMEHANIAALWARRLAAVDLPVYVSVRNTLTLNAGRSPLWADRVLPTLARWFYPSAQGVIAVSNGVANDLARRIGMDPADIRVLHNPVVTPELIRLAADEPPHPWFEPGEPPVILAAGRLTPQKAFADLIDAYARIRASTDARLMILGEGPLRADLEAQVERLDLKSAVVLPGFADNPFAFMRAARLFVLSSEWEGLPNVLIQAMACGCPVVSTDCPSGPSEILDGGRYGRLVPVGDVDALARAILETLNGPRNAYPVVERASEFSSERICRQYLDLLLSTP